MALTEEELATAGDLLSRASSNDLHQLVEIFRDRQKMLRRITARQAMAKVEVGATGRYSRNVKPQYLAGRRVKVTGIRQTKITVHLVDGPVGKFRGGDIVSSPASFIWDEKGTD